MKRFNNAINSDLQKERTRESYRNPMTIVIHMMFFVFFLMAVFYLFWVTKKPDLLHVLCQWAIVATTPGDDPEDCNNN